MKVEALGGAVAEERLFLVEPIEEPLQILKGVLLPAAAELGVVPGNENFEVERLDALLVLFLNLDVVDSDGFVKLGGVVTRVEPAEDFAHLAVEAISWYFVAGGDVMLAVGGVLLLVLWEGVEQLED